MNTSFAITKGPAAAGPTRGRRAGLATVAAVFLLAALAAAAPPGDDLKALFQERAGKMQAARRALAEDRPGNAATALRRAVALERELFGPKLDLELPTWRDLVWALAVSGAADEAAEVAARVQADTAAALGRADHWRAREAERLAADLKALAGLKPEAAARWRAALVRRARAAELGNQGKAAEALAAAAAAADDARAVWGDRHAETARGEVLRARGAAGADRPADAEQALARALPVLAAALGEVHPDHAEALAMRGRLAAARKDAKTAAADLRRAAALYAQALKSGGYDHMECLRDLARVQDDAGDRAGAIATLAEAIAALAKAGHGRGAEIAQLREHRSVLLRLLGMRSGDRNLLVEARQEQEEAVAVRRAAGRDQQYAWSLCVLGECRRLVGDLPGCQRALDEGLPLLRKAADGASTPGPKINFALMVRALAHGDAADYSAARTAWQAVVEHQRTYLPEDSRDTIRALEALASVHLVAGEWPEALAVQARALALRRRAGPRTTPEYAAALERYANTAQAAGDVAAARQALDEAARVARGPGFPPRARAAVLAARADFHVALKEWLEAEAAFAEADKVLRDGGLTDESVYGKLLLKRAHAVERAGPGDPAAGWLRDGLAVLKMAHGPRGQRYLLELPSAASLLNAWQQYDEAARLLREFLAEARQWPARPPVYQQALRTLALVETNRNRLAEARQVLDERLAVVRELGGPRHSLVADTLGLQASVALRQGDHAAAEKLFAEAVATFGDEPAHAVARLALLESAGVGLRAAGRTGAAASAYARAVDLRRRQLDDTIAGLSERQQLELTREARRALDAYLALTGPGEAGEAYARVLAWKGAVSARQQRVAAVRRHPERQAAFAELERVSAAIATAARAAPPSSPEQAEAALRGLSRRREQLERDLAADPALAAELAAPRATPAAVAAALPEGAALVDVLEYEGPLWVGLGNAGRRLTGFVVRPGRPVARVDLGPVSAVRRELEAWAPWAGRRDTPERTAAAGRLRQQLWAPLLPHLEGVGTVVVSPDGMAGRVPLAALPGSRPGTWLGAEVTLAQVAVPQGLPELLARPAPRADGALLLVGDVDFNAATGEQARGLAPGPRFAPLQGTAAEVDALARLWADRAGAGAMHDLRRGAATEPTVRDALPRARYAHLATHGHVREAACREPARAPAGPDNPFLFTVGGYAPAALAAIALAGANRQPAASDDGLLTALEVAGLDLGGTELVVLSACDTAVGRAEGGEGMIGLQRAFQVAGARSVVASLWPVDDAATQALMTEFYRNLWARGRPKAEALREAQRWLRDQGRAYLRQGPGRSLLDRDDEALPADAPLPPYFWAGFVLSGDWR